MNLRSGRAFLILLVINDGFFKGSIHTIIRVPSFIDGRTASGWKDLSYFHDLPIFGCYVCEDGVRMFLFSLTLIKREPTPFAALT